VETAGAAAYGAACTATHIPPVLDAAHPIVLEAHSDAGLLTDAGSSTHIDGIVAAMLPFDFNGASHDMPAAHDQAGLELVFIDPHAANHEQLLTEILQASNAGRMLEVIHLDATHDGVAQIGEVLSQHQHVAAVHLITDPSGGAIQLGNVTLNAHNRQSYASELQSWQAALAPQSEIHLHGND